MFKFLPALILLISAPFQTVVADIGSDLASGESLDQTARNAREGGVGAGDTVRELVNANQDPVAAVLSVVGAWSDCDATFDAVGAGADFAPDRAADIAGAVASLPGCGCSGKSLWSRSRLEGRLIPGMRHSYVEVNDSCACSVAAVEASVAAAPGRGELILNSALTDNCGCTGAAVGAATRGNADVVMRLADSYSSSLACAAAVSSAASGSGGSGEMVQYVGSMTPIRGPITEDTSKVGDFGGEIASPN